MDWEDFLFDTEEHYLAHHHEELNNEQIEWLEIIYKEYADDDGYIDWSDHGHDSAWYYYLTEVLDIDEDVVDKYSED